MDGTRSTRHATCDLAAEIGIGMARIQGGSSIWQENRCAATRPNHPPVININFNEL
jgi:hypothetical protein